MSTTGDPVQIPTSNFQSIIDALDDYAELTGLDLSKNPFIDKIRLSGSVEDILRLLQERENAFKEYRDGNRRLMGCLSPVVRVIHAFSVTLGEALTLVPLSPAKAIFAGIDVLLTAASGVSSSYDALFDLFECLDSFLRRLDIYSNIEPTPIMTDIIVKIMVELLSVLALATKQIKQGRFKKFAKKLLGESEIEATLRRLDRLTQDEARSTVAQTLHVVHGLVNSMRVVMEDGKASTDGIRQALVSLQQVANDMNKMKRNQFQREVRYWLSPPDPSSNHDFIWKAHHKGTATWFFKSNISKEWKEMGSLLWIHGKPGSGKSTLLSAIIEDIEEMRAAGLAMMAYYYFDFRDLKKQDRNGLLSSLLSQFSSKSDPCYEVISQMYSNNAGGAGKPSSSALTKCLKDMLLLPAQGQIYIIIDALDECPNTSGMPSAREEVLELVGDLVGWNLPNVYLCVASRPEIDIRTALEPLELLQISLHDEPGQKEDIIEYIRSVVRSDRNMRKWRDEDQKLVIDTLSQRANGMFRWVVCQLDNLRRNFPASLRSALADLPEGLDQTYKQALLRIDKAKRNFARRLFQCLSVSIRPLSVDELAEIFAIQFDEGGSPSYNSDWRPADAEEAVLAACSSLIAVVDVNGLQIVQFSHFSVKEFLTSDRLAKEEERLAFYHVLPEPAHTILARVCLGVLLQLDDKINRDTICRFPLSQYAARHWIDHAQFWDVSSHIQDLMERLFDQEKPQFAAWVWLYDKDRHWVESMSEMHPTQPEAGPLYYASLCGFSALVEHLVSHSPDVNARGGSYVTPLHAASAMGHSEIVQLLLENNADPNSSGDEGWAPLHTASYRKHLDVVKILLDANVDMRPKGGECTPLHPTSSNNCSEIGRLRVRRRAVVDIRNDKQDTPLYTAAAHGNLEIARFLLDSGANVNVAGKYGWTPLHGAAIHGYRDIAQLLLDLGANIDSGTASQWTPLATACDRGMLEVSRLLIDRGADIESRSKTGGTPLHWASREGKFDVTRLLLECGADVNARKDDHWTPLHFASNRGHLDIVNLLIQHGAYVDSLDDDRITPLSLASSEGYLDIARFLIGHGADLSSVEDVSGWTPLHFASYDGKLNVVEFLLECGVDVNIRSRKEETPFFVASRSGKVNILSFLIENDADIHATDEEGWDPLHIASLHGCLDVVRLLVDAGTAVDIRNDRKQTPLDLSSRTPGQVEVSRLLIERGADILARDDRNWTPLHYASQFGHVDTAQLLLDYGVDPNVLDDYFSSPLHLASAYGHFKVAQLLVQRRARIDVFDERNGTPLGLAALNGKVEVACILIDNGANLLATDNSGETPLHSASKGGHLAMVKLLLRRGARVDILNKSNERAATLALMNNKFEVAYFLMDYETDPNVLNNPDLIHDEATQKDADEDDKAERQTSLHMALEEENGNLDVIKSLLAQGADINTRNLHSKTPLHLAATNGNIDAVRLLLERGAEVDPRDRGGRTPLHEASRHDELEISKMLIESGANVDARRHDYWTPLHLSANNGNLKIVELLLECGANAYTLNIDDRTPYQLSLQQGHRRVADLLREHGTRGL